MKIIGMSGGLQMSLINCIQKRESILMEGALGERLKREYDLAFDRNVAMAKLIYNPRGKAALKSLWTEYINIAKENNLPILTTTPTRRANQERVQKACCDETIIIDNVTFLKELQKESKAEMYVGGLMGCKGDAYTGEGALPEGDAKVFHKWQADLFKKSGADFLYAGIMPTLSEAAGMAQAMEDTGLPYIISFTIKKDGKLIDGTKISDAIVYIDNLLDNGPVCYMTNCVHPRIVYEALTQPFNMNDMVRSRFCGIQANTSPLSYEELDGSLELKCTEPETFAEDMMRLRELGKIKIFGGCCGTDNRHMKQVAMRL